MRILRILALVAVVAAATPVAADDIELTGGTQLEGIVLADSEQAIHLLLPGGDEVHLARADVATVERRADAPKAGQHLRYREPTDTTPGGLDVAVTTWLAPDGPRVDLVGAVHLADEAFFRAAQRRLDRVDVTLFEAVLPEGATTKDLENGTTSSANEPLRALQTRMAKWLGLTFQLEGIDYTRPHFVHADMTAEELTAAMGGEPGDEVKLPASMKMAMRLLEMVGPMMDRLMSDDERSLPLRRRLKRQLASVLGGTEVQGMLGALGARMTDVLLHRRNDVALAKVDEIRAAKDVRSIAVFYGAAHMEGIEKGLEARGYRRGGAEWLAAWSVE
ncbi:MAG: hypothetical protein AB7T63_03090 [Planctomycetota bacterium]